METLGDQFLEEMRELSEFVGSRKIQQFKQELETAEKRNAEIDSIYVYQAEGKGKELLKKRKSIIDS